MSLKIRLFHQFVYSFLHSVVIISGGGQLLLSCRAVAPLAVDDLSCKLVNALAGCAFYKLKAVCAYCAADGVFAILAFVDHDSFAAALKHIPFLEAHPKRDGLPAVILRACDFDEIALLEGCIRRRRLGLCRSHGSRLLNVSDVRQFPVLCPVAAVVAGFGTVAGCDLHLVCPLRRTLHGKPVADVYADMSAHPYSLADLDFAEIRAVVFADVDHAVRADVRYAVTGIFCAAVGCRSSPTEHL